MSDKRAARVGKLPHQARVSHCKRRASGSQRYDRHRHDRHRPLRSASRSRTDSPCDYVAVSPWRRFEWSVHIRSEADHGHHFSKIIWYRAAEVPAQTWQWFNGLNREEWMVVLVVVCACGFVSLLGFQPGDCKLQSLAIDGNESL